jgi:hypothetical protein
MPRTVPNDAPQFSRFSSQELRLAQFDESPPKLKPMNGAMKPSARAGLAIDIGSIAAASVVRHEWISQTSYVQSRSSF